MKQNPYLKDIHQAVVALAKANTRYDENGVVIVEADDDDEYDEYYGYLLKVESQEKSRV